MMRPRTTPGAERVASGAATLTAASLVATALNYLLNVGLGRWLRPQEFADVTLIMSLLLIVTGLAIGAQLLSCHASARSDDAAGVAAGVVAPGEIDTAPDADRSRADGVQTIVTRSWQCGAVVGSALVVGSPVLAAYFGTATPWPFVLVGLGMPLYLAQAAARGALQGSLRFLDLSMTFLLEAVVRASVSLLLVALGFGVTGAAAGLALSFVASWCLAARRTGLRLVRRTGAAIPRRVVDIARPMSLLLLAQVVIANEDVLFAKRLLDAQEAGRYGVVALIGRGVFFASWSVATVLFPTAQARSDTERRGVLGFAVAAISAVGVVAVAAVSAAGDRMLVGVFGAEYRGLDGALSMYVIATTLFAIANLTATYQLGRGETLPSLLLLAGAGVQSGLLLVARASIDSIVSAQLAAMALLLAAMGAAGSFPGLAGLRPGRPVTTARLRPETDHDPRLRART